jgi:hypothetical protein
MNTDSSAGIRAVVITKSARIFQMCRFWICPSIEALYNPPAKSEISNANQHIQPKNNFTPFEESKKAGAIAIREGV